MTRVRRVRYWPCGLAEGDCEDIGMMARDGRCGPGHNPCLKGLLGLVSPGQV